MKMMFNEKVRNVTWNFLRWEITLKELKLIALQKGMILNGINRRNKDAVAREVSKFFKIIPPEKRRKR